MQILKETEEAVSKVVSALKRGEVVICPTDTVYGFLADAKNEQAVEAMYQAKRRARNNPFPLFIKNMGMAKVVANINKDQEEIIKQYWPGRYTFILRRNKDKNMKLFGVDDGTVALRMPSRPFLTAILREMNRPLVQSSVNIAMEDPLNIPELIIKKFDGNASVSLLVDGGSLEGGVSSQIMDITNNKINIVRQ